MSERLRLGADEGLFPRLFPLFQDTLWGRNNPLLTHRFSEHCELSDLVSGDEVEAVLECNCLFNEVSLTLVQIEIEESLDFSLLLDKTMFSPYGLFQL